jgi:exodeoxyribonuclease V alpha subunit
MPETLTVTLGRVLRRDAASGFTVVLAYTQSSREPLKIVADAAVVQEGETASVTGEWEHHRKYGRQFRAETILAVLPASADDILSYLEAGHVKGIGLTLAKRLVDRFGDDLLRIMDEEPDRLREVQGVGARTLEKIRKSWEEQHGVRNVMIFLSAHGVSARRAFHIHRQYGDKAIAVIRQNPYRLAHDVRGLGFDFADKLARSLGHDLRSPFRLMAGLRHVIDEARGEGHCGIHLDDALDRTTALLRVERSLVAEMTASAVAAGVAIEEELDGRRVLFDPSLYRAESRIASRLAAMAGVKPGWSDLDPDDAVRVAENESGMTLDETQRHAVDLALTSKAIVITGGPGVGKTTLVRALLAVFQSAELRVALAAPTGRAAKRLAESTGTTASTIHRLLETSPDTGGFKRDEENPLEADVVIVDEASMVDVPLLDAVLRAMPSDAAIVLVGDADQLPSIGPGQVLYDILGSGRVPNIRLTRIYRQRGGSQIIANAHRINRGEQPQLATKKGDSDSYLFRADTPEKTVQHVVGLLSKKLREEFGLHPLRDVQVIAPMRPGPVGIDVLNASLQAALNPPSAHKTRIARPHGVVFCPRDKVMQTVNNYDKGVFNGDVGVIASIDAEGTKFEVDYGADQIVAYELEEADQITLAYATTIHKSQGSEYEAVVVVMVPQHAYMLQRNLLYTAVTRGRRLVVVVGTEEAVAIAVRRGRGAGRVTRLQHCLIRS